ncbi:TetR/AcrR family transcriptional regulator [Protofrankia symbiont of Coriaria ruscifolia]|uniref:TetR/AcrR family transcriptional regulator n=1 Tax=Protofrankia symbiont of Coriaria ruscifolia TaxID=1306542 RepID=UPI0010415931|nr:TetR/AcrR family transcriptional regulator [Protofrankia symbiont of Coriaria ruscifolia]
MTQSDPVLCAPSRPYAFSPRATEIIAAGRRLLEAEGADALTMRRLGAELGIQAPSIYKHLPGKYAVELALVDEALAEIGLALHQAVRHPGPAGSVASVLAAYREYALAHPNLYRLATGSRLPRGSTTPSLEDWSGEPFFLATGDPQVAQAMFSFAHGMVILELDQRFPDGSDLQRTWDAGADAFVSACRSRSATSAVAPAPGPEAEVH